MLNYPAVDVAIGLTFLFFILALICSGINEAISSSLRWRAQDLERGLWELLRDPAKAGEEATAALDGLKKHPLIAPMFYSKNKQVGAKPAATQTEDGLLKTSARTAYPSYIPSRTFTSALLGLKEAEIITQGVGGRATMRKLGDSIDAIPSEPVRNALGALLTSAQGDAVAFRHSVEQWYDDHMERVSGWYRKRIQKVLWILAFVVAVTLNADALQIGKRLWVDPSQRAAIVNQAQHATTKTGTGSPADALGSLPIPLGWHLASSRHDPQGFPFYEQPSMAWALLAKLIGLIMTTVAISFGAPFWFDTLSKLARLRNSGAPPPASDALRVGEGAETRVGPITEPEPEPEPPAAHEPDAESEPPPSPEPEPEPSPEPKPKPRAPRRAATRRRKS